VIDYGGRTAIVTGGGNGIGLTTVHTLAGLGAAVGVLDVDGAAASTAAEEVDGVAATADVSDPTQTREAITALVAQLGQVDLLVNNAGVSPLGPVEQIEQEQLLAAMAVNVGGALNAVQAALPQLRAQGGGRIVNVASWLGVRSRARFGVYCATKAALISLTRTMALELAPDGIAVNAVLPGAISDTPMRREADAAARAAGQPTAAERAGTIPLGRLGTPQDVANAIAYAGSEAAGYMTGDTVGADGGVGAAVV
jgi:NAD(P)-dependent dehydrogenase (short-subunit alcohol dehydrogenase family)